MKVNEIKETKIIEELVRTEYIAEDGTVFRDKEECEKYEKSALFAVSQKLKRIGHGSHEDVWAEACTDNKVEIFNAETEEDIENIKRYAYLVISANSSYITENSRLLPDITAGHEVIILWNYDKDYCWTHGDGSAEAFANSVKANVAFMIEKAKKDKENKKEKENT